MACAVVTSASTSAASTAVWRAILTAPVVTFREDDEDGDCEGYTFPAAAGECDVDECSHFTLSRPACRFMSVSFKLSL